MQRMQGSYFAAIGIVWCLNGWALLQHVSIVPAIDGFIAAVLVINMLAAPLLFWIAFVYGEVAEEEWLSTKRKRAVSGKRSRWKRT